MFYVFFDVECANCLNGEGKMCSLGYVKTDEEFHVLKKKDILIDPNAPFLLGNAKTGQGIHLAYPLFRFKWAHTFPSYYQEIKRLLEDKDTICFGFAVNQDVSYISYTCQRYHLPLIDFKFFDIQSMEKQLNQRKNLSGLDHLVEEYQVQSFTYHRSDDDALMTMEVFKALLDRNQLTVEQVLKKYPQSINDTMTLVETIARRKRQKQAHATHAKKVSELMKNDGVKPNSNLYNPFFYEKTFFFDNVVLSEELDYLLHHKKEIYFRGAKITKNLKETQIVVLSQKDVKQLDYKKINPDIEYVEYSTFKKELSKRGR